MIDEYTPPPKPAAVDVKLCVGGQIFVTSRNNLLAEPRSIFASLLSGQQSADGSYFIDRDARLFPHVIQYIRARTVNLQRLPTEDIEDLKAEAEFYGMPS